MKLQNVFDFTKNQCEGESESECEEQMTEKKILHIHIHSHSVICRPNRRNVELLVRFDFRLY